MATPPSPINAEEETKKAAELQKLAAFLASGALYTPHPVSTKIEYLPNRIQLHCSKCGREQTFQWANGGQQRGWGLATEYQCRNCGERWQKYFYTWQGDHFWKVGQSPELREDIDNRLDRALGPSRMLYRRAVRSRSFGFGIGSLAYLRRIIEDTTETLMDLLREDQWESWTIEQQEEFEHARTTYQYSQKITYAAKKILPPEVFAGGRDSFAALHDVTSSGLHGKTEEECIELFDRCNLIFTHSFRNLADHKQERDEFAAQLRSLQR